MMRSGSRDASIIVILVTVMSLFSKAFQSVTRFQEDPSSHVSTKKVRLLIEPEVDTTASNQLSKTYFTQFRSLSKDKHFGKARVDSPLLDIKEAEQREDQKSRIDAITKIPENSIPFKSNQGTSEAEFRFITNPALYSFREASTAQKENFKSIAEELGPKQRLYFRGENIKLQTEELLDVKFLDFQDYSTAIAEKYSNQLFQSLLKAYGQIDIDEQVSIPERYQVREKKVKHNASTLTEEPEKPKLSKLAIMRANIHRCKSRSERNDLYFDTMEDKLIQLLDYVLQEEQEVRRMPIVDRIKFVLNDLGKYKHQLCQGESKVNLLLFFFKEFQILKEEKTRVDRSFFKSNEQETKRHSSVTPSKAKPSPLKPDFLKPSRGRPRADEWIGVLQ